MIIEFAERHGMIKKGDKILCAVSGGADSMCLLHYMAENAAKLGITVMAAHFDHRLRGEESDRDRKFVADMCRKMGVECAVGAFSVAAFADENGLGIEEAARIKRYEFLEKTAAQFSCTRVATAHNRDDNAETVLINLARGSGAKGLCGIPPVRGIFIRPLLDTSREQIESYVKENGVPYVTDSSNLSDDYTRNVLRHKVMPVLREVNPEFTAAVLRTSEILREDEKYFNEQAECFINEHFKDKALPVSELLKLPAPVRSRVFRLICGKGLTSLQEDSLNKLCTSEGLCHADIRSMRVTKDRGMLYFGAERRKICDTVLCVGEELKIGGTELTAKAEILGKTGEVFKSLNKLCFNYAAICGTISLTSRRDGDKIRLAGRNCTKSLKELFRDADMPQTVRDKTPVIRDEKGIIGIYGFGVAERCKVTPGDTVLCISLIEK